MWRKELVLMFMSRESARNLALAVCAVTVIDATNAQAQVSTVYEQFYLPADHNWAFRNNYPGADRLFNAFDYGHAILYEDLWTRPDAPESKLEVDRYDFITKKLLVRPPRMPLEEAAIEVAYARLAPEAKVMFDWAHLLHRQIYDVWADESIAAGDKDARIAELLRYYKSRPDLAFSSKPKDMDLMEGRYYSKEFRTRYPKFNGLIWAYHWLQVGLYEPLVTARDQAERQTGVTGAATRFREMLENPPAAMPTVMPMTAAIAPEFARRYPEAAIIFDNLHGMHDVISDILSSPKVARRDKRREILEAARLYRDDTSFVMTERDWLDMSIAMGVENMGGTAASEAMPIEVTEAEPVAPGVHSAMMHSTSGDMAALFEALFADSLIRSRIMGDSTLSGLVRKAQLALPEASVDSPDSTVSEPGTGHQHVKPESTAPATAPAKQAGVKKPANKPARARKPPANPPAKKPAPNPHSGH